VTATGTARRLVHRDDDLDPRWFWPAAVIGGAISLYGMARVAESFVNTPLFVRWLIGLALVHDLVVAPLVGLAGWVLYRLLPRWAADVVVPALAVAAVTTLFAWPLVRGYGYRPSPSHLPRDYGTGLAVVLAGIGVVAVGLLTAAYLRHRGSPARSGPPPAAPRARPR
jgi:hypothetical protein